MLKYGNQTLDQIKNLELRKVQDRIKRAEAEQLEKLRRQKIANTPGAMTSGGGREVSTDAGAVAGAQQDISNYQSFNEVPLKKRRHRWLIYLIHYEIHLSMTRIQV